MDVLVWSFGLCIALIVFLMGLPSSVLLKLLGYEVAVDIMFFIVVKALFYGSLGGITLAFVGGAMFSLFLHTLVRFKGFERYEPRKCCSCGKTSRQWIYHPPRWSLRAKAVANA